MPHSLWQGALSFGLVTVPISLHAATDSGPSVSFVRVHKADGGRVRNQPVCSLEDEAEVPTEEIGRGYQTGEHIVPLTDDDLAQLPLPTAKTLTILAFVPAGDVDPLQVERGYYVAPNGPAANKPYVLLRDAMDDHGSVAIGKIALRSKETLALVRPMRELLVLHSLRWPDQIRTPAGVVPDRLVDISEDELAAAEELMDSYGPLNEEDLRDHYREQLEEIVAAKLEDREVEAPGEAPQPRGQVLDLMAALEDSVRAARSARGEDADGTEASVTPLQAIEDKVAGTTKRSSARKSARTPKEAGGKKTTGKAPAKKTAAKNKATGGRRAG
ncbi:Ku protein [Streptomyces rimosus]|uniref:Non-homologous end joining protein Ku n=3 Tax=Streptomyces rimosus TaxID=1927 RepID=L8F158_STRR1|nr:MULTISPECIES: Ku protein [Streptomyces]KOG73028.1 DNA repair protein [Kitasatospora aureofaciens]MYT42128.1 Ku protein [Streptomyces sp. SID5471]KEF04790.1 DNA repair protein [Streptomyces rimosus]KOT32408.1 DNA repair protein [Streptomyces sp. NRRL WC-3701]KOT38585.1 DNA repair protein [Streptomyces rimosus subsp. rimosus]